MNPTSNKVNVLFVMFQFGMGGSERLVYNLAQKLNRTRFNPSVAWFGDNEPLSEFKELQIPLYYLQKKKRHVDFSVMHQIHRIIKEKEINVVNAQHFMPAIYSYYGCKIKENRFLIYTAHSVWEINKIPWRWKVIGKYLLNHIDTSVGVSQKITESIRMHFKTDVFKILTIENGIDIDVFKPNQNEDFLKQSLGINENEKVIGVVANFQEVKNHRFLLQAFAKLIESYENVRLILIGSGFINDPYNTEGDLRQFVNETQLTGKVHFLGYRSDIPQILRVMDIFCLTSFKEGLPISLIEAMATGLPVVGTNVEGIRDVIVPNHNGFLVELGDVHELKNILLDLLNHPEHRERLGRAGRQLAEEKYSLDRCVSEYEALFLSSLPSSLKL